MKTKTEALLERLHERIAAAKPVASGPRLKVVRGEMDSVTRESHIRMISSLRKFYKPFGIDLIVNQALIGKGGLDDLGDGELVALLRSIDRARECISDGISFEEAGLIRASYE